MAFRINSNIAALNALRHLHDTEEALSTNLERLSSGRKFNLSLHLLLMALQRW